MRNPRHSLAPMIPLHSLLSVPPSELTLVVDNARSPAAPKSLEAARRSQRQRRLLNRCVSLLDATKPTSHHRWSSNPPPLVDAVPRGLGGLMHLPALQRSRSLDDAMCDGCASPMKLPNRYVSPPTSPNAPPREMMPPSSGEDRIRKLWSTNMETEEDSALLKSKLCLADIESPTRLGPARKLSLKKRKQSNSDLPMVAMETTAEVLESAVRHAAEMTGKLDLNSNQE